MIEYGRPRHSLTPAEMRALVKVDQRGDSAPMVRVSYDDSPNERTETVIPWREALEIEDE